MKCKLRFENVQGLLEGSSGEVFFLRSIENSYHLPKEVEWEYEKEGGIKVSYENLMDLELGSSKLEKERHQLVLNRIVNKVIK